MNYITTHLTPYLTRIFGRLTVALVLSAFTLLTAQAQSATASLSGTVTDEQGAVVAGADLKAVNDATNLVRKTTTNADGFFTLPLLPPGVYTLNVERTGFAPVGKRDVILNVGDQRSLLIQLRVSGVAATVNVTSDASLLNESPSVGTVVDRQFIANQPLNGRSFYSLIELAPGVVQTYSGEGVQGEFSVNGQRSSTNYFTVDGVSANFGIGATSALDKAGGTYPAFTLQGTTATLASIDAIEEFAIQTSSYAPEFGRQPGAQVQIVTRSGTNRLHGTLFNYLRNDKLDANDWFANANGIARPALRQNDFGGTLGGPMMLPRRMFGPLAYDGRDRTFFFFSYEGLRLRQPVTTSPILVPTVALRNQATGAKAALLRAFPLPTGAEVLDAQGRPSGLATFVGSFSNPASIDATSFRLDQRIGASWNLFGRYNYSPNSSRPRAVYGAPNEIYVQSGQVHTTTVGLTGSVTPKLVWETRFNYSLDRKRARFALDDFGGAAPPPDALLFPAGLATSATGGGAINIGGAGVNYGDYFNNRQSQINLVSSISWQVGTHAIRAGFDYRRLPSQLGGPNYQRYFYYDTPADVLADRLSTYILRSDIKPEPIYRNYSGFVQDTWRPANQLTLTYGLRYDVNPAPTFRNGTDPWVVSNLNNLASATLAPAGTPLYETRFTDLAPRFGVAYHLRNRWQTTIRGGAGLFYDLAYASSGVAMTYFYQPYGYGLSYDNLSLNSPQFNAAIPPISRTTIPYDRLAVYEPGYKSPYSWQYNLTIEQTLSRNDVLSAGYVGSVGRRLGRLESLREDTLAANTKFTRIDIQRNSAESDYHALQLQYRRRLAQGLQAIAAYTFSKSLDNASNDTFYVPSLPVEQYPARLDRGPSNFDVRHNFTLTASYELPSKYAQAWARHLLGGFAFDGMYRARSATPINIVTGVDPFALGLRSIARPDLVPGKPIYLYGDEYPGGRRINPAAFVAPPSNRQGTLGRNAVRGLSVSQFDLSLRRRFPLTEKLGLDFRVDAFNLFNHANFADSIGSIYSGLRATVGNPNFGLATQMLGRGFGAGSGGGVNPLYQIGGPRSLQMSLKLNF